MYLKIIVALLTSVPVILSNHIDVPEDGKLDFSGLAIKYGGAVQAYDVTTEDGYILKVFRIPGKKASPVLFMHGLFTSSDDFIIRGNSSLAITLLRAGYDLWFSNYRGNRYSRRHVSMNPDTDSTFWQFGPHEHGCYDLAASIDFVLNKTGERQLSFIGHSEGTLVMYILGAERPEYNDKIKVFIALAPVCYLSYVRTTIPFLVEFGSLARRVLRLLNINELAGYDSIIGGAVRAFCAHSSVGAQMCRLSLLTSMSADGIELDFVPIVMSHVPAGTSRMNLEHSLQIVISQRFARFDYGPVENLKRYRSKVAPDYDLRKVTVKTYLIAAKNDLVSVLGDHRRQLRELPNVQEYRLVKMDTFNHIDFTFGRQAPKLVYARVLKILNMNN